MNVADLSDEEFARRGNEIFEKHVLPQIDDPEAKARHFVVIDIK
jgi:archaeosine-15-forming tRNA-guanine transglycosylase